MREDVDATVRIVWYSAVFVAVAVGVTMVVWWLWPKHVEVERAVFRNSHQYVETKRDLLLKMAAEVEAAEANVARYEAAGGKGLDVAAGERSVRDALIARIGRECANLSDAEIPASVRRYAKGVK